MTLNKFQDPDNETRTTIVKQEVLISRKLGKLRRIEAHTSGDIFSNLYLRTCKNLSAYYQNRLVLSTVVKELHKKRPEELASSSSIAGDATVN